MNMGGGPGTSTNCQACTHHRRPALQPCDECMPLLDACGVRLPRLLTCGAAGMDPRGPLTACLRVDAIGCRRTDALRTRPVARARARRWQRWLCPAAGRVPKVALGVPHVEGQISTKHANTHTHTRDQYCRSVRQGGAHRAGCRQTSGRR